MFAFFLGVMFALVALVFFTFKFFVVFGAGLLIGAILQKIFGN